MPMFKESIKEQKNAISHVLDNFILFYTTTKQKPINPDQCKISYNPKKLHYVVFFIP